MNVTLHPHQLAIFHDPARFKVVAAGRRFGKSFLAAVTLFVEASKLTKVRSDGAEVNLTLEEVYYIAPTFEQGKKILWPLLREIGADLIQQKFENTGTLTLINGRRISIKGADRPDSIRGIGLSYVVMDEYAFMKEEVWETIIVPALGRVEGGALFIGTPDGKNHFYNLWVKAMTGDAGADWKAWTYHSVDNPHLPTAEIERMKANMSEQRFRQEMEASFESGSGIVLTRDMFTKVHVAPFGDTYVACDLAGFVKSEGGRKIGKRDDHAIVVVINHQNGWCIKDVIHGRWDTRETALRLVKAYRDHRPVKFGIEQGMSKNAVHPYLSDEMNRLGVYFEITELRHGNQAKTDRIAWAIQGRAEKGRITYMEGDWNKEFLDQCVDFPSQIAHDDIIDALAYVDQMAEPWFDGPDMIDNWSPMDLEAGY